MRAALLAGSTACPSDASSKDTSDRGETKSSNLSLLDWLAGGERWACTPASFSIPAVVIDGASTTRALPCLKGTGPTTATSSPNHERRRSSHSVIGVDNRTSDLRFLDRVKRFRKRCQPLMMRRVASPVRPVRQRGDLSRWLLISFCTTTY